MNDVILVHEYIVSVLPEVIGNPAADGRVVVAHLGSGASMCAMRRRRCSRPRWASRRLMALPMGQRCGDLMIARHTLAVLNLRPG